MISTNCIIAIEALAKQFQPLVYSLPEKQPLITKGSQKWDRLDTKLSKESKKINNREYRSEVKLESNSPTPRKGSITYRSYTIEFKKKLISSIRKEMMKGDKVLSKLIREKANKLKIHPKNINRWYHAKEIKKKEGGRKALYPEMEVRLANFILNNPKLRRKMILDQAKQIMEELNIPGRENFNFSKGWYERFRERLSKSKIFSDVKVDEQNDVKYEVKIEDLANDDDNVKSEEEKEEIEYDSEESYNFDDEYDSEDEANFEDELQRADREEESLRTVVRFSKPRQTMPKGNISYFFDQDDEANVTQNTSLIQIIKDEEKKMKKQSK